MATKNKNITSWMTTHPGTILKYELEEREISQKDFAEMIGMQKSHLNELIKCKRPMTKSIADKIEDVLGISSVSLVNLQTQYEYNLRKTEEKSVEEQSAINSLKLYDEIFDVKTLLKRFFLTMQSAVEKIRYFKEQALIPEPAELQMEVEGMFKKSSKTGQDPRMLMTWKILAETTARKQNATGSFSVGNRDVLIKNLSQILHKNTNTIELIHYILSENGIVFCIEEKVDKASVDGYSFIENGTPYIVLTKRYDRIDNFAFALLHEIGHIYLHYLDGTESDYKLSIPDYDNESPEEKEANEFATNALIPNIEWKKSPKVRLNPITIQKEYTQWAEEKKLNKWIVLGRISYETGMYRFRSDENRRIG
ncbi:MAG: ImmA/IrrE family metallo-endopeptidase [Paludibacteraceae bacterium]|nr:ImmA/IrrE family metallo-endopeptidase [Paludibacteraceae bacterium]